MRCALGSWRRGAQVHQQGPPLSGVQAPRTRRRHALAASHEEMNATSFSERSGDATRTFGILPLVEPGVGADAITTTSFLTMHGA
jgi:hypothetical protein